MHSHYIKYTLIFVQIEVDNRETGEMKMNNRNYVAFIYFPKNYTIDLIKYIDDRKHFDMDSRAYVHLTKESKLNSITFNAFLIKFFFFHDIRYVVQRSNIDGFVEFNKWPNEKNVKWLF